MSVVFIVIGIVLLFILVFAPIIYFLYRTLYGELIFQCPMQRGTQHFTVSKSTYYGIFIEGDLFSFNQKKHFQLTLKNATTGEPIKTRPALIFARRNSFSRTLILDRYVKLMAGDYILIITPKNQSTIKNNRQQFYQIKQVVPDFYFAIWFGVIFVASQLVLLLIQAWK